MTLNNEKSWNIIQISDTHFMDQDHLEFVRMNPEQSFHHVMQHIVERHPQLNAIVHTVTWHKYLCLEPINAI